MREKNIQAYIIPSEDEHQSEYVANYDKRREWISGFTGSAGVAVVTLEKAALWTDGRYFIRADQELDKAFWVLMKEGITSMRLIVINYILLIKASKMY
jgi:Xaa-Pro aminopeptidase